MNICRLRVLRRKGQPARRGTFGTSDRGPETRYRDQRGIKV